MRICAESMSTRRDHPILEAIGTVVLIGVLVAIAPGAVLTFAAERFLPLRLNATQRWTWAVASSVIASSVIAWRSRDGLGRNMRLAVVAPAVVLWRGSELMRDRRQPYG